MQANYGLEPIFLYKAYWNRKTKQDNGVGNSIWMYPLNRGDAGKQLEKTFIILNFRNEMLRPWTRVEA